MTSPAATFVFDEQTYTIPTADEWSIEALEAFEDGKIATLMREVLGSEQWATFKAKRRTMSDLNDLFGAANKALDSGN